MFVIDDPHARLDLLDPHWQLDAPGKLICRRLEFDNFCQTLQFVNAVGYWAEKLDHHPDFHLGYNFCAISLTTHDADGLTELDFRLAALIDELAP